MPIDNDGVVVPGSAEPPCAAGIARLSSPAPSASAKTDKMKSKRAKRTSSATSGDSAAETGGKRSTKEKKDKKRNKKEETSREELPGTRLKKGNDAFDDDDHDDDDKHDHDDDENRRVSDQKHVLDDKKLAAESPSTGNMKTKKTSKKKKEAATDDLLHQDVAKGCTESAKTTTTTKKKSVLVGLKDGEDLPSTPIKKKTKSKKSSSKKKSADRANDEDEDEDENAHMLMSPGGGLDLSSSSALGRQSATVELSKFEKYSVEYFEAILQEVKHKCQRKIKLKTNDRDAFADACTAFYETWYYKVENEQWLNDMLDSKNGSGTPEQIAEAQQYVDESNVSLPKCKRQCIRAAIKLFENSMDEERMSALEERLVKGAIIAQATPQKLADFAAQDKGNEKLLKRLLADPTLMKEMLRHGGAAKYEYGNAIKIYFGCIGEDDVDDKEVTANDDGYDEENEMEKSWARVDKRIALACALELAAPVYEFDSTTAIDAIARYKHFEKAHRRGELDPAFPFFSVWEMRQVVNCDAPNEQMEWCRDMVMNYVPHLTCLTDHKLRYVYMLLSDVRIRQPEWTASPRTYPMVLSGGGNESINSWFGRFLLKSFGLPAWGTKHRRKEGYTRWTPNGWEAMNGADWDNCSWQGKTGKDFKTEIEARNKAPPEEYFKKLVMLQCLADVVDEGNPGDIPEEEKDVLHGDRLWRSLSIVSMALLFETEPEVPRTFERKGRGLVVTKCEKYLTKYENDAPDAEIQYDAKTDVLTVPSSRHEFSTGNIVDIESYEGGKQVNFVADGIVEFEIPDSVPANRKYTLACEVCTVSSKQTAMTVEIVQAGEEPLSKARIKVPYTVGKWDMTEGVEVELIGGAIMKVSRPKGSLGVAIKKFVFTSTNG